MIKDEDRYDSLFRYYAERSAFENDDWLYFKAQAKAESAMDPRAKSPVGAQGLCQFMPATWKEWCKTGDDPFNPEASISAQIRYMKWLIERVRYWDKAFAAYNWGIGNMLRYQDLPGWRSQLPDETKAYIVRINDYYQTYKRS